jgi:hypothetical protein
MQVIIPHFERDLSFIASASTERLVLGAAEQEGDSFRIVQYAHAVSDDINSRAFYDQVGKYGWADFQMCDRMDGIVHQAMERWIDAYNEGASTKRLEEISRQEEALFSWDELAFSFDIYDPSNLQEYIINVVTQGRETITIHNHPSHILKELEEDLRVLYDFNSLRDSYEDFRREKVKDIFEGDGFRKAIQRPSKEDLEVTKTLSTIGIGVIISQEGLTGFQVEEESYHPVKVIIE